MPVEYEDGTKGIDPGRADPRGRVGVGREQGRHPGGGSEGSEAGAQPLPGAGGRAPAVKEGELVTKGDNERRATILYTWDPYNDPSIIKADGELRWKDLVPGVTLREELDEGTGLR